MNISPQRAAVLALHWQVNVIKPEGFFGAMLAEPVARSGVVGRAVRFHAAVGVPVFFTRFTIPEGEGELVRNTGFMRAVGDAQEAFRSDAPGAQVIPEMIDGARTVDNQSSPGSPGTTWPTGCGSRGSTRCS
jgi:biuret amidohydrolase